MDINLGIHNDSRKQIIGLLNLLLADETVLYLKTRNYHWNVTGMHFAALHDLFEKQYKQLETVIDDLAERIRALGGKAHGTLQEYTAHMRLKEEAGRYPSAPQMVRQLAFDHEAMIRQLRQDAHVATEAQDDGSAGFLGDLLLRHEKMAWMTRAHLEE
jgi:starvation-inducible DNA-binding protein